MEKEHRVNRLKTTALVGQMMDEYYTDLRHARQAGRKVAWAAGIIPTEILVTANVSYLHLESFGAYSAARKANVELKKAAEAEGYSPDICSYIRTVNGLALLQKKHDPVSPDVDFPLPDFIIGPNGCKTQIAWLNSMSKLLDVPGFALDLPITYSDDEFKGAVTYVKKQYEDLIAFLEEVTGRPFDHDRLKSIVADIREAAAARQESLRLCRNIPSPMTAFEAFISVGPMMLLRGRPGSTEFYHKLNEEIRQRVSAGIGSLANEKHRLYWDNLPIWFKLGSLSEKLAGYGANLVASAYTHYGFFAHPERIDPERPLESMAEQSLLDVPVMSSKLRMEMVARLIEEYALDGMVIHSARTCRPYDIGQYDIVREMGRKLGVPGVIIDGDPTDPDYYSDAETDSRLEAFFHVLEGRNS